MLVKVMIYSNVLNLKTKTSIFHFLVIVCKIYQFITIHRKNKKFKKKLRNIVKKQKYSDKTLDIAILTKYQNY